MIKRRRRRRRRERERRGKWSLDRGNEIKKRGKKRARKIGEETRD